MNAQWKDFLEARSAEIDERGKVAFPAAAEAQECALCDLSHLGMIAVAGPDAETFLQGQLTNDIRELSATHSQLSGHCNPKGRMLASFRALRLDDIVYLQLPRTMLDSALRRLRMYTLRARVTLTDASDELIAVGLAGECAAELLRSHVNPVPDRENDMSRQDALTIVRLPGQESRFQILGAEPAMEAVWDALAAQAVPVDADYWGLLDIRAGIPTVFPETTEAFVPQMVNMHLIDGVSFTKGCYTGQEVVARMQYLGKLKRRMYIGEVDADVLPRPGDELHAASSTSEQATGRVVDARAADNGRCELLAVVEVAAVESGEICLGAGGPTLTLKAPPYGFPTPD